MARNKLKDQEPSCRPCLPPCRVCGDQAAGYHYGVNTCEACKGFFHRSLRRYKEYTCRTNRISGYCEYKPGKRKSCQFCRYQRCLMAGMSKEAIKTGRYTYTKRMNDTKEINRLQSLQHHMNYDCSEPDSQAPFLTTAPTEHEITELPADEFFYQNFVEVDSATKEEFERLLRSEDNYGSRVYLPDSGPLWSSKSVQYERHKTPATYMKYCSPYCNSAATGRHFLPLSMVNVKASSLDCEIDSSSLLSKSSTFFAANSRFARQNSDILYNSDTKLQNKNCHSMYDNFMNVNRKLVRNSILYRPERIEKLRNSPAGKWRQGRNRRAYNERNQQRYLATVSPETEDSTSDSMNSNYTCTTDFTDSLEVDSTNQELPTRECEYHKLPDSDFDLFPDISFNLNGQPPSSPSSFANDNIEAQILNPVGECFSLKIPCPSSSQSSERSLEVTAFNIHSGNRQQSGDDDILFQEPGDFRKPSLACIQEAMDQAVLQDMDVYKGCLDLSVDSRTCSQESTVAQNILTGPDSSVLDSMSSSSNHPLDNSCLHKMPSITDPYSEAKDVQYFNIAELYKDKDAVIATLMASHKVNDGDYSHMPKEEMFAQQKAHYEACELKKQTFGHLGFLPEHEYDEIYSVTGIDVDNRRTVIRKFLNKMEKDVRDLVQFAKSIPGFTYLDINLQTELVKLARAECFMLSHYRTVNLELGIMVGLTGEHWACYYELGRDEVQPIIADYVLFSDRLQKMVPTQEEEVLLKAIIVVSTDGDTSVQSPLAEAIRWQLVMCLLHSLEKHRHQPSLFLARYILALTQSRTLAESTKDFLREMKLRKYSSIEQNPLLWEICSWIVLEKRDDDNDCSQQQNNGHGGSSLEAYNGFTV